jgi:hypothetical protein
MSAGPDPSPSAAPSGALDVSRVAAELDAIFAGAQPTSDPVRGRASRVRAVASRRRALPYATLGAVAAAALVGLTGGVALMARGQAPPRPASPLAASPHRAVAVQAAAPTVTLPTVRQGPIPVLDNTPVAPADAVRPASRHRAVRHVQPGDLMAADRRLRAAYAHAVSAGVPRHVLAAYRDRWADLREDATWRPDRVAAGYGEMSVDLERLARRSRGRQPPPRFRLFDAFS